MGGNRECDGTTAGSTVLARTALSRSFDARGTRSETPPVVKARGELNEVGVSSRRMQRRSAVACMCC